jgi:dihydroorotate dehydrogenase/NAD-dependent dihydropyrimidine dehydrogenase PreA subunit
MKGDEKMDLSVRIGDRLTLANPLMPASGPLVGDSGKILGLIAQGVGGIVTKTISVRAAQVPRPCIIGGNDYIVNTELWSEYPPERWEEDFLPAVRAAGKPTFVSLGYTEGEILSLIPRFERFADAFELSTHYLGRTLDPIAKTIRAAARATDRPIFIKLSPHIPDPVEFAKMVKAEGGYGLVAINSLGPVYPVRANLSTSPLGSADGFGWISGPVIKPLSLAIIRKIATSVDIPIIGVGGVGSAQDVIDFLKCGASAVQMLSAAMLKGKTLYRKIISALPAVLESLGFSDMRSVQGLALKSNTATLFERRLPVIDPKLCTLCNRCVENCPYDAMENRDRRIIVDPALCFGCGLCESRCPARAISGVLL